jgi:hypothetical protein
MLDLSAGRCSNGTQYVITRRGTIINSVCRIKCIFLQPGDIVVPNEFETVFFLIFNHTPIEAFKAYAGQKKP